jgi:Caspase domain
MPSTPRKSKNHSRTKPKGHSPKGQALKKSKSQTSTKPKSSLPKSSSSPKSTAKPAAKSTAKSATKATTKPAAKSTAKLAAKPKGKPSRKASSRSQSALVVGISAYTSPLSKLPAVAADVREIGKILKSKDGAFRSTGVAVLTEESASRKEILSSLHSTFGEATADQTVFVYLAGHGGIENGQYYFIAHDTDCDRMKETGVPLSRIKALFDASRSHRVFLWLDFCHSGGMLVRGRRTPMPNDQFIIKRTIGVVQGHGKLIFAACSPTQSAYENPRVGHGLFTDALLRGLKGGAVANGEVTSNSLFDFIDREIGSAHQRPMQFGHMEGRIVLMHYQDRSSEGVKQAVSPKTKAIKVSPKKKAPSKTKGTWVMLGRNYFLAQSVKSNKDGNIVFVVSATNGDEESNLAGLRPGPHGGGSLLPFAFNNDAGSARVREVESEMAGSRHDWTITLTPQESGSGGFSHEMSINTGSQTYSADDIARLRAGRILLNDPSERSDQSRSYGTDSHLESYIRGISGRFEVRVSPIRSVYAEHGRSPNWKHYARLQAVYTLKASGTVDHILELTLGVVRSGKMSVKFRGRRSRLGSEKSTTIEITGVCPLG